jgi:hypothetical protein
MPRYNGNCVFIAIDGVSMGTIFVEMSPDTSLETHDSTSGACATHVQRLPGLKDNKGTIKLIYDTDSVVADFQGFRLGRHVLDYGPDTNQPGKPRHTVPIIITNVKGPAPMAKKETVFFEISYEAADAPLYDMYEGATW